MSWEQSGNGEVTVSVSEKTSKENEGTCSIVHICRTGSATLILSSSAPDLVCCTVVAPKYPSFSHTPDENARPPEEGVQSLPGVLGASVAGLRTGFCAVYTRRP